MTPDDLDTLIDRLLDDALTPDERAELAARLAEDPLLRQQLSDELALALQIRATLADDTEQRADLLLATLSGSRRLTLENRINQQIDTNQTTAHLRWVGWTSAAAAALLAVLTGVWWLGQGPAQAPRAPVAVAPVVTPKLVPTNPVEPAFTPAVAPVVTRDNTPAPTSDGAALPALATSTAPETIASTLIASAAVTGNEPAPTSDQQTAPAPAPSIPSSATTNQTVNANEPLTIAATQAKPAAPAATPRALRQHPPLQITGSARLRRLGHESVTDANARLVPGDELTIAGEGAELTSERGVTWWAGPGTRLTLPMPKPTDAVRQPLHLVTGTLHVTAGQILRPLITTPHIRIDVEDAELWITVTSAWTRVETISGSVRLGTKAVRPLVPGSYAVVLPGLPPSINPAAQTRLAVIAGRFARNGEAVIPRIVRGVPVAAAAEAGATAVLAPLGDAIWLDQAAAHGLLALADVPALPPSPRILKNPALTAWVAEGDARGAPTLRRVDPLRAIHLAGPTPARLPAWATSSELSNDADGGSGRALLSVITVNDHVRATTWDALVRGAQGVIWTVTDHHDPGAALRPLAATLDATTSLLTDGTRTRLSLGASSGSDVSAARWDLLSRRLIVVVNRSTEARPVELSQTRGLQPLEADDSIIMTQSDDVTSAQLPPGAVLVLLGNHS